MRKLVIRLKRCGAVRKVSFEIIVTFRDRRANGSGIEKLGYITKENSERFVAINGERLGFWLNKGAILHSSVKYCLKNLVN